MESYTRGAHYLILYNKRNKYILHSYKGINNNDTKVHRGNNTSQISSPFKIVAIRNWDLSIEGECPGLWEQIRRDDCAVLHGGFEAFQDLTRRIQDANTVMTLKLK